MRDPRIFQIVSLFLMLCFGVFFRDFSVSFFAVCVVLFAAFATQWIGVKAYSLARSSYLSALISALSLLLLCRAQSVWLLAGACFLAIMSKFVLTFRKKHFFNPTNFGILAAILLTDGVWVSPAQWGESTVLAFWFLMMGSVVVQRSSRFDIALTFLGTYLFLLAARVFYLGQVWSVFFHQLNSGSLILFSLFMISDPRSTPDHPLGRIGFAVSVALLTFILRFSFFHPQAILWALFLLSPLTFLIDTILKSPRFEWTSPGRHHETTTYGRHLLPSP